MSRYRRLKVLAMILSIVLSPTAALAIGSIVDGNVTFAHTNDFSTSRGNTVDTLFTGAATGNQQYESWWFFRVQGDGSETAFGTPDIELYSGSTGYLTFLDPGGAGFFSAVLGIQVFDTGTNSGNLFQVLSVTNTSGASLTIDIFHYSDLEVGGNSAADSATLGTLSGAIVLDVADGTDTAPIGAYGADEYWVSEWGTGNNVLKNLTDGNFDNLGNRGLPFGAGDFTAAFQWSRTFDPGQTLTFMSQFGSNSPLLNPLITTVPESGTAILMGLGLIGLSIVGSRKRAA